MRGLTFGIVVLLSASVQAQNWQDEEHVWNEEKGKWEVSNKAGGRVADAPVIAERNDAGKF
jgi:hypothetical protein